MIMAVQRAPRVSPDDAAGIAAELYGLGSSAATLPTALTIPVQGSATDLMFCREQGCLKPVELMALMSGCLPAYYQALASPQTSPHARFDVTEWLPLSE